LPAASPTTARPSWSSTRYRHWSGKGVRDRAGLQDLIDHDQLRHDPVMAVLGGKLEAKRADCAPLVGKSTLNRLELSRAEPSRFHKINYEAALIEAVFVDIFLDAHPAPPSQIILDLDATDDPLHGHQVY
jgi:hypothetical protein